MDFDGLHICLLTDQDLEAGLPLPADDWPCDPRPYLPEAEWVVQPLEKEDAVPMLLQVARQGFDVYFNLCDGAFDEARPGIEVVHTLERLGVPFTGGHAGFFEPSREAMKRVCEAVGVDAPGYVDIQTDDDIERAADTLRFPLIVKHPSSYASAGLTPSSRVTTVDELWTQVSRMRGLFHGALVEEFIEGDEYTVLVAENPHDPSRPVTYQPLVYRFPAGETFKHEHLKWVDYDGLDARPVTDPSLDARLREASGRFFVGLGGSGYARCDIRVDAQGRVVMLELNPNCGLFYPATDPSSADLILRWDPAGHEGFVRTVVEAAIARHTRSRPAWRAAHRNGRGFTMVATRDLPIDELVFSLDGQSQSILRRERIASIEETERLGRLRGAWPLTEDLWVAPPDDPMAWRPLQHSCDPSAWVSGLELRARRPIAEGDEITVDYATLYDDILPEFQCECGAASCRGFVRGSDWKGEIVERFGDRISDYIRARREAERSDP
jgi:D-alanine-D-alanine ligase